MTDAALIWSDETCRGDLAVADFDLARESGLRSAVLISLFTDRRATPDDLPDGETDRRGWWGDGLSQNDRIGSLLWTLGREKETREVAARAQAYATEALLWMVEDGVARAVAATAEWTAPGHLLISVRITLPDGSRTELQFEGATQ